MSNKITVWVTRGGNPKRLEHLIEMFNKKPKKARSSWHCEDTSKDFVASLDLSEFAKLFGFTPEKGSIELCKITVERKLAMKKIHIRKDGHKSVAFCGRYVADCKDKCVNQVNAEAIKESYLCKRCSQRANNAI